MSFGLLASVRNNFLAVGVGPVGVGVYSRKNRAAIVAEKVQGCGYLQLRRTSETRDGKKRCKKLSIESSDMSGENG